MNVVQLGPPAAQDQLSMSLRLGINVNIGIPGGLGGASGRHKHIPGKRGRGISTVAPR